ncbi:MAG: hypothetical protein K1X44_02315, partial [Alphaproteobacteria bacterium]|nr:hypothetical protein [Alphaproteobacteria bacterium]
GGRDEDLVAGRDGGDRLEIGTGEGYASARDGNDVYPGGKDYDVLNLVAENPGFANTKFNDFTITVSADGTYLTLTHTNDGGGDKMSLGTDIVYRDIETLRFADGDVSTASLFGTASDTNLDYTAAAQLKYAMSAFAADTSSESLSSGLVDHKDHSSFLVASNS